MAYLVMAYTGTGGDGALKALEEELEALRLELLSARSEGPAHVDTLVYTHVYAHDCTQVQTYVYACV